MEKGGKTSPSLGQDTTRAVQLDGICLWKWNTQTGEVVFEGRWPESIGPSPAEAPGSWEEWKERIHPEDRDTFEEEFQSVFKNPQKRLKTICRLSSAPSGCLWMEWRGQVEHENDGDGGLFICGSVINVSDHVQTAQKLKKSYEDEKARTLQAAKLASLGELSASLAHEINNPLMIVIGSARLAKTRKMTPEKSKAIVERIESAAKRIQKIVTGLRKFSRATAHDQLVRKPIAPILEETQIMVAPKAKTAQVQLTWNLNSNFHLLCNDIEIQQVIINLVGNAIDAVENLDERYVEVRTSEREGYGVIQVIDSGEGVANDIKDKVFSSFFTTKSVGKGTGLGLSISKRIVEDHGGLIHIDSIDNRTCFELNFPIISADDNLDAA